MNAKIPLTILIPTINAESHIVELLDCLVPYFEDVIVVDSLSLDKTVDICLHRGVKIIQRRYVTSSDQFGWMITKIPVSTPWVMLMAQDERISEELRKQMAENLRCDSPHSGYTVKWRLWFMGQPLHAAPRRMTIYRTGKVAVTNVACNEHFYLTDNGTIGNLDGYLEHKDTPTLWDWYEKQNLWTTREAIQRIKPPSEDELPKLFGTRRQRNAFFKQFLIHMPFGETILFWYYFLKFGAWRDGRAGWVWASLRVWVHHVTTLKEKEMRKYGIPEKIPEGRHGGFDPRILASDLQRQLLPETIPMTEMD